MSDREEVKTGKTGPLAMHTMGAHQIYGTKTLSEEGPVPEKPGPSLLEAVRGWASSSDIIKFILPVKP